jgi:hypothetical protein
MHYNLASYQFKGSYVGHVPMPDYIAFLRKRPAELRSLAQRDPTIADPLRRIANELDAKAADLERNEGGLRPS